jgi:pyruvate/2-oxoglutarate dehydrogenase complex dihydrolipoamide dehydrogenase (E3) component
MNASMADRLPDCVISRYHAIEMEQNGWCSARSAMLAHPRQAGARRFRPGECGKEASVSSDISVLVLGGGPAGITSAMQARQLGATVTVLEADLAGGTSYNSGPAPVRTLARAARLARDWSSWETFGLRGAPPQPDLPAALRNSDRVARYAHDKKHFPDFVRGLGIELHEHLGPVRFRDPHTVETASGSRWAADRIIIAVGGRSAELPVPGGELALTYNDIRSLTALPARVAVVGAADTGVQIASILADFGVRVVLLEAGQSVVPSADPGISAELRNAFEARGIVVRTGTLVTAIEKSGAGFRVLSRPDAHGEAPVDEAPGDQATVDEAEAVFVAVGWPANLDDLDLGAAGVASGQGAIPVDAHLRSNVEHIFAAGDVNGLAKLVQTARLQGRVAAWNAVAGATRVYSADVVPSGSFTDPEYGRVGLTEPEAAQGHDIVVGVALHGDLLRPVSDGRPDGFCKLIADRRDHTILGAHVIGEYAAETVQVAATAMAAGMTVAQVAELQYAFPTFTESVAMAAQKICRELEIGEFPMMWSNLGDSQ